MVDSDDAYWQEPGGWRNGWVAAPSWALPFVVRPGRVSAQWADHGTGWCRAHDLCFTWNTRGAWWAFYRWRLTDGRWLHAHKHKDAACELRPGFYLAPTHNRPPGKPRTAAFEEFDLSSLPAETVAA